MNAHDVGVFIAPDGGWRAECTCGLAGETRERIGHALADADQHEDGSAE
jgi:hypothetical protein